MIDLPTTLFGWITLTGFITMGFSTIWFQWKNQNLKLLREQVEDMIKRIKFLEERLKELEDENGKLKQDYKDIHFKKNYLKQIVIEALASKKGISDGLLEEISSSVTLQPKKP